jgi:hypothetical protein
MRNLHEGSRPTVRIRGYMSSLMFIGMAALAFSAMARCEATDPEAMNVINIISPYRDGDTWVFDDPAVGLRREPFVAGIPAMIDALVAYIPDAHGGFRLLFSSQPFPGFQAELSWIKNEHGGSWYRWNTRQMEGWLCPALFRYFPEVPQKLYARAEGRSE